MLEQEIIIKNMLNEMSENVCGDYNYDELNDTQKLLVLHEVFSNLTYYINSEVK